jgi:hypothetical protein
MMRSPYSGEIPQPTMLANKILYRTIEIEQQKSSTATISNCIDY